MATVLTRARDDGAHTDADFPRVVCLSAPTLAVGADGALGATSHDEVHAGLATLRAAGATRIGIACNSLHRLWDHTPADVVDLTAALTAAVARTGARHVGLLAASATVASGLHRHALHTAGITTHTPPPDAQAHLDDVIAHAAATGHCTPLDDLAATVTGDLIVLACTELDQAALHTRPCVDSVDVLADALLTPHTGDRIHSSGRTHTSRTRTLEAHR